jgi:hypothetical protein
MLGPVVDTVIAMATLYLVLSLLCTSIQEFVAQFFQLRSKNLKKGLDELIGSSVAKEIMGHGLMAGLAPKGRFPSRIPADRFVATIFEKYAAAEQASGDVRKGLEAIPDQTLRQASLALYDDASGNVSAFKTKLGNWFDESMVALGGRYRANVQVYLVIIATIVTVSLNFDSLKVAQTIWTQGEVRQALVEMGMGLGQPDVEIPKFDQEMLDSISTLAPIGWDLPDDWKVNFEAYKSIGIDELGQTFVGWLISIAALSFGAPFWFDILKSIVKIRGDGSDGTGGGKVKPQSQSGPGGTTGPNTGI